jgi:hypothetical protein
MDTARDEEYPTPNSRPPTTKCAKTKEEDKNVQKNVRTRLKSQQGTKQDLTLNKRSTKSHQVVVEAKRTSQ